MRFYQRNGQWMMDVKRGNENWQAVCRGMGQCQLQIFPAQKVHEWQMLLPRALQTMPMACINNVAFACQPNHPERRLYWWFAWRNGHTFALGLNRIR